MERKSNHFSGQLGFVLAAAGSAVGVGNLWRFPYLAAKDGGGLFLIIYFILVLTFGFTLLTSDIAIGRRTQKSAIGAYTEMKPKWKFLGILTFLVPVLIMTYYGGEKGNAFPECLQDLRSDRGAVHCGRLRAGDAAAGNLPLLQRIV